MKEQITICIDSQAALAALPASGTKSLLEADCIEKLTVFSEVNQVTIMWVPRQSGIQQYETGWEPGPDISVQSPSYHYPLPASGTKSLLEADCIEKLTVFSEVNQVTMMWVPRQSVIQQYETADWLVRMGARTRSIGPESFLPLSLSRFKPKIRNWIEKRKQTERRVCER